MSSLPILSLNVHGDFYPEYKAANSNFDADTFNCAERAVAKILETATTSDHPGMLLGKVQSGKTRTFISVLALAFDNGFDIAIVLTKNSRPLVEQTSKRLKSEFTNFINDGEMEIYDIMHAPDNFTAYELDSKLVFVAKKQKDNLNRLQRLFAESCPAMSEKRVLIIDDEADSASIGYSKKGDLIEANTIASQISDFRSILGQTSFLQVTATPYSLYLQPTEIEVDNKAVFKPTRPAFTELVPVPDAYVGGETYFGASARSVGDTLESLIHFTVDHRELDRLKKKDGRWYRPEEILTTPHLLGFRHAIIGFIVGGIIQRINGVSAGQKEKKLRYSFLLHSEAARGAHDWQDELTDHLVNQFGHAASIDAPAFTELVTAAHDDFSRSLILDGKQVPSLEIVIAGVREAMEREFVTISKVNSDEDVSALLDDTGQLRLRSPLCIFIGGQVLDRGVTLANLIGFYYGRRPNKFQQDTVLQHSRMYGYRRADLAVTRFYTSMAIRHAMFQMEEFDSSLRAAIEAGGDQAVQFIRRSQDGRIVPCSPNKILIATTQTLRPFKRLLPIGFQSGYRTGQCGIGDTITGLDVTVEENCGFNSDEPVLVPLEIALQLLSRIEPTLHFPDDEAPPFDWDAARAALTHLSHQHPDPEQRGNVYLWAANNRNSARLASAGSHATYIETPDSEKTEGDLARQFAINHPILFMLRQNGIAEKGWRDTPFYWPVVRAQANAPTAIYTAETID